MGYESQTGRKTDKNARSRPAFWISFESHISNYSQLEEKNNMERLAHNENEESEAVIQ